MGLAEDLLKQANHLASYEGIDPSQAALRRAVSTAYYALFHLLVQEAAQLWNGTNEAVTGLERAFNHGSMSNTSRQFANSKWRDWHGIVRPVPPALGRVAQTLYDLQQERHTADYNSYEQWTAKEVQTLLDTAAAAFQDWSSIRLDPMAGNYLLAMLLGKPR